MTQRYQTTHHLRFHGCLDDFDDRTDRLLEALEDMAGVEDVDLAANLVTGEVDLTFVVATDADYADVGHQAVSVVRAAIHEIGDDTPGWEQRMQEISVEIAQISSGDLLYA